MLGHLTGGEVGRRACLDLTITAALRPSPNMMSFFLTYSTYTFNWLRVSDTAERSQVDQRIGHQLHAIVPLLEAFKAEQQPLELVFPGKGPLDTHPQGIDGG